MHSTRPAQAELDCWRFGDYQTKFQLETLWHKNTLSEQWDIAHLSIITIPSSGAIEMNYSVNNIMVDVGQATTVNVLLQAMHFVCQTQGYRVLHITKYD